MHWNIKRIVISGLAGGCGKTFVSIGIISALKKKGINVFPFKKGPDYIDSAWLSTAVEKPCYNLDTFLMSEKGVVHSFEAHTGIHEICKYCDAESCANCDRLGEAIKDKVAVIEGNRGLFDGMDENGTYSTAELAKLLNSTVVLVLDCTKSTRTLAAQVLGCQKMDINLKLSGVILNRVAGKRHENIVRSSIEKICNVPVIGAIPKLDENFPQRHLGLITPQEHSNYKEAIRFATEIAETYIDLKQLLFIADSNESLTLSNYNKHTNLAHSNVKNDVRIGVISDTAFSFYYPDNLEALKSAGAEIVEINAIKDHLLPDVDGVYIGGGFPETNAMSLAENKNFKMSLKEAIEDGMPVYAECGGAIYMGRSLVYNNKDYQMTGVLPLDFYFENKPQGHGYTVLKVEAENPFFELNTIVHGHEFHYSKANDLTSKEIKFVFSLQKGYGFNRENDGIIYKNLLAVYSHIHSAGTPQWAPNFVKLAKRFSNFKKSKNSFKYDGDFYHDFLHNSTIM